MEEIKIGDKVYLENFMSETGVVEEYDENTRTYKVRLDSDSTVVDVKRLDLSLCK